MRTLNKFITEKLKLNKDTKVVKYNYFPKTKKELRKILEDRLKEDKDADLNDIDVSKITYMENLFENLDPHNIDISEWNVSNVITMEKMFCFCKNFDCNLSKWNVRNVAIMNQMFYYCESFKGEGLDNWKVDNNNYMFYFMFDGCTSLKNKPSWYKNKYR